MMLDPDSIGRRTEPRLVEWTDRETLLYALGVGCGVDDLAFTTENSHRIEQQVLPTFAVIACPAWGVEMIGSFDLSRLLHGSQRIRLHSPLPAAGKLNVTCEIADILDKGEGKNAVVVFKSTGVDPVSGDTVAESEMTSVIRGAGGFGGVKGSSPANPVPPEREPDHRVTATTTADQALVYRLSGDRNPLHSDPEFAARAGFPRPILHGLCTFGIAGRALVQSLCDGDASKLTGMSARFTAPVLPGESLTTSVWLSGDGAVFHTDAHSTGGGARRVLEGGMAQWLR
jgi:acyl dehydratase